MEGKRQAKDLNLGDTFESDSYLVTKEEMIEFAKKYDPQFFHVDEELAKEGPYGELISSGLLTVNLGMRLWLDSTRVENGWVGFKTELTWVKPVKPGDSIRVKSKISELKPSSKNPNRLKVVFDLQALNQDDQVVLEQSTLCFTYLKKDSQE
ncbi:bifunctional aldehyde dehydrogenase/enoyl-CoA hydratase [Alloiococcus otitis]|uniref:MaoC-like domain-containing protein n=1 Tax=Alloiococcus otitis ATCC 51267 TaxID=883081 RepID=K9EAB4_9LACT|nr:MaoC/PaaZ C-terminal domain-containing protein [Alloiococcus otitis]EKU93643.1 hypothetical protein HMPREF9698_00760 [Alloiococcus otitis ATCC 51267]SUU80240.1 bifunctional aldehyde dehydrogenase/enoyl-CoA hydratase [Alloiococcus otitis]